MASANPGTVAALESSVYGSVINRVITSITALNLSEITTRVYFRKFPFGKGLPFPCCIVSPAPETSRDNEGPVSTAVVHYRVMVSLIRAANRDLVGGADVELLWRQKVSREFRKTHQDWAAVTGAMMRKTTVQSGEPFLQDAALKMLDAQFLLLDIEVGESVVLP